MSKAGVDKPSMLMDIEARRRTEVDFINGKFVAHGYRPALKRLPPPCRRWNTDGNNFDGNRLNSRRDSWSWARTVGSSRTKSRPRPKRKPARIRRQEIRTPLRRRPGPPGSGAQNGRRDTLKLSTRGVDRLGPKNVPLPMTAPKSVATSRVVICISRDRSPSSTSAVRTTKSSNSMKRASARDSR